MRVAITAAVVVGVALLAAAVVLRAAGGEQAALLDEDSARSVVSVEPRQHLFGDTVQAQAEVVLDRERIDPERVTLRSSFEPYELVGPERLERADVGQVTRLRWVFRLVCLEDACLPDGAGSVHTFAPAIVLADGRRVAELEWPQVAVSSRLTPSTGSARRWSSGAGDVPPPTFRMTPAAAVPLLAGLAALLAAAGALLLGVALWRKPRPSPKAPPLERALALLQAARRGDRPLHEERKALDLLSVELSRHGESELAQAATELAWARERPDSDATDSVANSVQELIRTRNGTHA